MLRNNRRCDYSAFQNNEEVRSVGPRKHMDRTTCLKKEQTHGDDDDDNIVILFCAFDQYCISHVSHCKQNVVLCICVVLKMFYVILCLHRTTQF